MERSTIHLLHKRGKSQREIASELGRSRSAVARALSEPVDRQPSAWRRKSSVDAFCEQIWEAAPRVLVLTGGSTALEGTVELAEEVIGLPTRRGVPRGIGGLVDVVRSPAPGPSARVALAPGPKSMPK